MKKTLLSSLLTASSLLTCPGMVLAADYYVVVPVTGKTANLSAIQVSLASASLPAARVGAAYSFDFNQSLQVTGDATYTGYGVAWALASGSLPSGLALNTSTGVVSGTPTVSGNSTFALKATYKTKTAQQAYSLSVADYVDYSALMAGYTQDAIGFTKHAAWSGSMGNTYYWNTASGAAGAVSGDLAVRKTVTVANQVTARVKYLVDDYIVKVEVNGTVMFSSVAGNYNGTGHYSPSFTLRPGINVVAVTFNNVSGPAGFVAEIRDASTDALLSPVSGWKMQ